MSSNQQRGEFDGGHHTPKRFVGACAVQRGDVARRCVEVCRAVVADIDPAEAGARGLDGVAQAVRLHGVTGERRGVDTGVG